jgi:hypothetical protein
MRFIIAATAIAVASPAASFSVFDCDRPKAPYCLDAPFYQDYEAEMCRSEVESFVRKTKEFVRCSQEQIDEATKAANKTIERWNCRASNPQGYC